MVHEITEADRDEAWQQRVAKGDGRVCPRCFGVREAHRFPPDKFGGAKVECCADDKAASASHDRELAANLRGGI